MKKRERKEGKQSIATISKPPSDVALATAWAMRRFDPKLTDDQIDTIARAIDENASAGARLNSKKKRLRNADEPVTTFAVKLQ